MIKFKAWNASNSRAIAKFHNTEIGHFGHNAFIHEVIRGSLVKLATGTFHQPADVDYLLSKVDNQLTAILLFCLNFLFENR